MRVRVILTGVLAVLLLAAGVALYSPLLLPSERLQQAVNAAFGDFGDLGVRFSQAPGVTLTPLPVLALGEAELFDRATGRTLVRVKRMEGRLGVLSALMGRTELAEIVFHEPAMEVVVAEDGTSNWDRAFAITADRLTAGGSLPHMIVLEGDLGYHNRRTGERLRLQNVDVGIDWPSFASPFIVRGSVSKDGESLRIDARLSDLGRVMKGGESNLSLALNLPTMAASIDGKVIGGANVQVKGTIQAEASDARAVLRWLGHEVSPRSDVLGRLSMRGDATVSSGRLVIDNARVHLDNNVASGAVSLWRREGRLEVRGTLDAGALNLTPYFNGLSVQPVPGGGWSHAPVDMAMVTALDLDLRLSAEALMIGDLSLANVGAAVTSRGGKINLTLGDSNAYGGVVRGALSLSPEGDRLLMDLNVNAQRIDLAKSFSEWFGLSRLEGTGNVRASLRAVGTSVQGFVENLQGEVGLIAIDGAIAGVNAEAMLRRLERRPLTAGAADDRRGRTPFTRASGTFAIADGVARTSDIAMDGPNLHVALSGSAQLPTREIDFKGTASLKHPEGGGNSFDLPFVVQGPWNDPYVLPDPDARIMRSRAAAPLRDRLRDPETLKTLIDIARDHGIDVTDRKDGGGAGPLPNSLPPLTLPLTSLPSR